MIAAIACVDKNWGIGYQGDLLIKIPEDMKFFNQMTRDKTVVMGRKTYDSLPKNKKPLPDRDNVIITRNLIPNEFNYQKNEDGSSFYLLRQVKKILDFISKCDNTVQIKDTFIIGGGQVYKELLPYCEKAYITIIDNAFENADTYFPKLNELPDWYLTKIGKENEYNGFKYRFCEYEKFNYEIVDVVSDWTDFTEFIKIKMLDDNSVHMFNIKYYFHGSKTVEYLGSTNMPLHLETKENFDKFLVKLALYKQNKNIEV